MKKWLTDPQKAILYDLDKYIDSLPQNHGVKIISMDAKKFKEFLLIGEKVQRFPEHNSSVRLIRHHLQRLSNT